MLDGAGAKPVHWVGTSLHDVRVLSKSVRTTIGQALYEAQLGGKHPAAKPLKGFGGSGVLEIIEDDDGNTYRAVYTVKFAGVVYVLHAFQKKSKSRIRTAPTDIALIRRRLKAAEQHYATTHKPRQ